MQLGCRLGLATKALHRLAAQARAAAEHLQRHLAVERHLPGLVDDAHATAAQLADHLEVSEPAHAVRLVHRGHGTSPPPLVRRRPGAADECGLLCDALRLCGLPGFSATVILANLFLLPRRLDEILRLPKETFDTPEEVYAAGWRID
jgi:hypothetical protein